MEPATPAAPEVSPASPEPESKARKRKRKRCENCGEFFPITKAWRRFCTDECRKEYHRFGAAYGPLKQHLEKLIKRLVKEAVAAEIAKRGPSSSQPASQSRERFR